MREKTNKSSVLRRIYLLLGIVIVITLTGIIFVFLQYERQQEEEETLAVQNAVSYNASALCQQLDIIYNQERSLIGDSRVESIAYDTATNSYDRAQILIGLAGSMIDISSTSTGIGDIILSFPDQEVQISASEGYKKAAFDREILPATGVARLLSVKDGEILMQLFYPLTYSTEEDYVPDYGVTAVLSEEYLSGLLELFEDGDSEAFLLLDDGTVIGNGTKELRAAWEEAWRAGGAADSFCDTASYQGERELFVSERLSDYGITMVVCRANAGFSSRLLEIFLMILFLLIVCVLFLTLFLRTNVDIGQPIRKMTEAFEKVENGDLNVRIFRKTEDEFQYLYSSFNRMVEHIGELIESEKEQSRLLQNAELLQLQSQINPHFLYNSFYLIRIMAKNEEYEQIETMVTSLAKYYRFLNKEVDQEIVLKKEVEHMENYISIQQMRFGDKITVREEPLPADVASCVIPKLVLQPVLENAYNYGMKSILKDGVIAIHYEREADELKIVIEDNGEGLTEEDLVRMREDMEDYKGRAAGHALSNISRRLKLAYRGGGGIDLLRSGLGGLKVVLRFDLSVKR